MKTLTILTQKFRQELKNVNPSLDLHCHEKGTLVACKTNKIDTDTLTTLLERIVILSHPVYGHSPKLADMAINMSHTEVHQANATELTRYLEENNTLHLEGYATFRMSEYHHKLDVMMYCIIKKLKLTDSLLL